MDAHPKLDVQRMMAIWKWLLSPELHNQPENVTRDELVGVYSGNLNLLIQFRNALERTKQMYRSTDHKQNENPIRG